MRLSRLVLCSIISSFAAIAPVSAESVTFDYNKESAQATVEFDDDLVVVLNNVNRLDYKYKVNVAGFPPSPVAPPLVPSPTVPAANAAPPDNAFVKCRDKVINAALVERLATFGGGLAQWKKNALGGLEAGGCDAATSAAIRKLLEPGFESTEPGQLKVPAAKLTAALGTTAPGGKLVITVEATPVLTRIDGTTAATLGAKKEDPAKDSSLTGPVKNKVANHQKTRTFTVNFKPPEGILFSFGPFLSQLERVEYDRIADPADGSKFVIGKSEDSSESYGVAAYWSVLVWERQTFGVGFSWGVAYDTQNKVDKAVSGLVSVAMEFEKTPLLLHVGVAIGRQDSLAEGWELGQSIGSNDEIPLTASTEVELYLGISFRFGSR